MLQINLNLFTRSQVGDRILAVNDQDVRNSSQEHAISLIKNAGTSIRLEIQSFDLNVSIPIHF